MYAKTPQNTLIIIMIIITISERADIRGHTATAHAVYPLHTETRGVSDSSMRDISHV